MNTYEFNTGVNPAMDQHAIQGGVEYVEILLVALCFRSQVTDALEVSVLMSLGILFSSFLARLYWTLPRIGHQLHLLFSGFLVTFQILTSGDRLFLIHSTRPTKQQSTNYSISSLAIQHFLQGTTMNTLIIPGRLHYKRPIRPARYIQSKTTHNTARNFQVLTCARSLKPAMLTISETSKLCARVIRDSTSFIASVHFVSDSQETRPLFLDFRQ